IAEAIKLDHLKNEIPVVVFDEIHKFSDWKNFLKGLYDSYPKKLHIIVTGSARLDVYKKGGDSLMGRYFMYRFHPFTVGEILRQTISQSKIIATPKEISDDDFDALLEYGGFPDPFIKRNKRFFNQWKNLRFQQIFQEEVRDLTRIQELSQLEKLARILGENAGSQISYVTLSKMVRSTNVTVRKWIDTLRSLYYLFEVRPYSKNITRSLVKEPKYYLWDWSGIDDKGKRAENFTALHLLKAVQFWTDFGFGKFELHYLRDKEKREVDFLVTKDEKPWFLVEVKCKSASLSPSLSYFQQQTGAPHAFQIAFDLPYVDKDCFLETAPTIIPAKTFFSQLI
ncbi:MAG: AAA family ATPase, partial [Simkaniaceae bacterium]|nr:AAA family ATPase [Simkaniaceae bacterium]